MKFFRFFFFVVLATLTVNVSLAQTAAKDSPLRIAVYVDKGARNTGVFRWLELTACAKNAVAIPVDGAAVRADALDSVDVLVMPGGSSVSESKSLGPEGREKVKAFVKRGGGYVGTCAGCSLLMESSKSRPDMLHIIPFKFSFQAGVGDVSVMFNERAKELAGISQGEQMIRYALGPVPVPSDPVKDSAVEVLATYNGDLNPNVSKKRPSMAGNPAAIAGTYGKGKLFALTVHPEVDSEDHYVLRGAFRYVTGREVEWEIPQSKPGRLTVGIMCDDSFGVETARFIQKLIKENKFNIIALNNLIVASESLKKVDVVLVPDAVRSPTSKTGLGGKNATILKEFHARGGRTFAWGSAKAALEWCKDLVTFCDSPDAAYSAILR